MKKILYVHLLVGSCAFAQVGINTEMPNATLDVVGNPSDTAKFDGVIAPRITRAQLSSKTYTSSQTGAIVYVTSAVGAQTGQVINVATTGYYYFDGTVWQNMSGNDWKITGNSNTNAGINFLGTYDGTDLVFKTYNIERARFYSLSDAFNIGLKVTSDASISGVQVGRGKGGYNQNTIVGNNAFQKNVNGNTNTVLGWDSLFYNTSGNGNVAVGTNSLVYNTTGSDNIAVGGAALSSITGSNNIGIGKYSGNGNETGSNNIAIGNGAVFFNNTGDNQISIGNVLYGTGNSSKTIPDPSKKIGINVAAAPNSTMQVNGSLSMAFENATSGDLQLNETQYTVKIFNNNTGIILPNPTNCKGRIYVLIGKSGISAKPITIEGGTTTGIYDDVTDSTITSIAGGERLRIQSTGSAGWILIG